MNDKFGMSAEFGKIRQLEAEIEKLNLQLAACGVASLQNTDKTIKDRITRDHPYWSASYQDVCNAVDREMALRHKADVVDKLERLHKSYTLVLSNDGQGWTIEHHAKVTKNVSLIEAIESIEEDK